ncbi:MAG: hypothetical protein M3313_02475 [Actinomycetota bacterium]|nr:hypothetical protein [Actinomycetota bacterium]
MSSPRVPGACLCRVELAEAVNNWLYRNTGRSGVLDGNYIARLERGAVRRPGRDYRAGFRAVLGASDDAELGFVVPTRSHEPLRTPQSTDLDPARETPADDEAPATGDYLDELRRTISHLVAIEGVHGGAELAPIARGFRRSQRILGEGRYLPAIERDLEAVTAEFGELCGWLLFDAERQDQARAVNGEALNLAHIAGDASMEWFILSNQALASMHTGRDREALRISQRMTDRDELPGRVRALFDVRAARALASLGDETAALRAFDRAQSGFADAPPTATRCGPGGSTRGNSPGTPVWCTLPSATTRRPCRAGNRRGTLRRARTLPVGTLHPSGKPATRRTPGELVV